MRLKNLLSFYKINLISLSLSPLSVSRSGLSNALVSLILNIKYDPIVQSSVTYRKKSTGNQLTLNNLSHTPLFFSTEKKH